MSLVPPLNLKPERERKILEELLGEITPKKENTPHDVGCVSYKNLAFEQRAPRDKDGEKNLYFYQESLNRLLKKGYKRHLRPAEAMALLIDNLENKSTPPLKNVAEDILQSYGEWLSAAVECSGDDLTVYLDPNGLLWKNDSYHKGKRFTSTKTVHFAITGIPREQWVPLTQFDVKLVTFFYSKPYGQLPKEIQDNAQIWLPVDGAIRPVGRGYFSWYDVDSNVDYWASRGVARVAPLKK